MKNTEKPRKNKLTTILIILAIIIFIAIANLGKKNTSGNTGNQVTNSEKQIKTDKNTSITSVPTLTPTAVSDLKPFQTELSAGNYTAGVDFPGGVYTLTAKSGSGNVSSSNVYDGGLNEIMGTEKNDMNIDTFNNAKLDIGIVLSINGNLVLNLQTDQADTSKMIERNNTLTKTIPLSSGNYTAGKDFPAGVYDVIATKGSGNISSSNLYKGGLNEVMGIESNDFTIKEFKHAIFDEGVTLSISGVSIKLVPSK